MDSRRAGRPLGDVVGGPRRPAELLDQFRQRLDRLAGNHPSSSREPARERERGGDSPGAQDGPGQRADPGGLDGPAGAESASDGAELAGEVRGRADGEAVSNGDESASLGAGDEWWSGEGADHTGDGGTGLPGGPLGLEGGAAEGYLPWFMAPEDGAPWFAAEPGQPG